jgi:DNA-binding transcriptional LysR family regulator
MTGLGLALISAHTVAFEMETKRLAALDVEGLPIMGKWFIAGHADKAVLPAVKAFWAFTLKEGHLHLQSLASADPGSG